MYHQNSVFELDHFDGVVVLESQGVFGRWPFVGNFVDSRKCGLHRTVQESSGELGINSLKALGSRYASRLNHKCIE
jgi:hypothetical protein